MIINETAYADQAESVIKELAKKKDKWGNPQWITTSKIRNLLSLTADIYNEISMMDEKLSEEMNARIDYLRIRFVYESGRDTFVRDFVEQAKLIEALKEIRGSRKQFILFNRYLEALVAYHRFNRGKDY